MTTCNSQVDEPVARRHVGFPQLSVQDEILEKKGRPVASNGDDDVAVADHPARGRGRVALGV